MSDLFDASKLPYMGDKPATSHDVVDEATKLMGLIAAIAVSSNGSPLILTDALSNNESELGKSVMLQKLRLACAIESLLNHHSDMDVELIMAFARNVESEFVNVRNVLNEITGQLP